MERTWKMALVGSAAVLFLTAVVTAKATASPGGLYDSDVTRVSHLGELFSETDIAAEAEINSSHGGDECGSSDIYADFILRY